MNKNDLVNIVSEKTNKTKKDVNIIIDEFLNEIIQALENNEKVLLSNFGTFEKKDIKPIDIYSPYDGKIIKGVKGSRISFKSSKLLKERLNKKV